MRLGLPSRAGVRQLRAHLHRHVKRSLIKPEYAHALQITSTLAVASIPRYPRCAQYLLHPLDEACCSRSGNGRQSRGDNMRLRGRSPGAVTCHLLVSSTSQKQFTNDYQNLPSAVLTAHLQFCSCTAGVSPCSCPPAFENFVGLHGCQ